MLNIILIFLCTFIGIYLTSYLIPVLDSSVYVSALLGTVFGGLFLLFHNKAKIKFDWLACLYLGSFVGMISIALYKDILLVGLLALICVAAFYATKRMAVGYGGKLGTIAFLVSLIFYYLGNLR